MNLDDLPKRRTVHAVTTRQQQLEPDMLDRFSRYSKLLRVTAWCRWLPQIRSTESHLTSKEVLSPEKVWIKIIQAQHFKEGLRMINANLQLLKRSPLKPLALCLDEDGILRVRGRLKHSLLSFNGKHPMIPPQFSKLAFLLIDNIHQKTLHGGIQLILGTLRQRYWIPRARNLIKQRTHKCVTCIRWRAATPHQQMADRPRTRVTSARPFQYTEVNYAGPVALKRSPERGHKTKKAFLVIFVCMVTKAVHLEITSDYSTRAFLAALKRFMARRGLCSEIFSDRGTNFFGADAELRNLVEDATSNSSLLTRELTHLEITWRFNSPAACHIGGLWEAAVKSTKFHSRRVFGETTLTYEKMTTLLTQIKICMNSRPLNSLSDDPEDLAH